MPRPFFLLPIVLLTLFPVLAVPAWAGESAPFVSKRTTATLITEADSIGPDGRARIALRLRIAEGWHTYWRNPGEAGVPVELTPALSSGATAGPIDWPMPARIVENGIMTYGHEGEILLPLTLTLDRGVDAVSGRLQANWLVCKDICVPEEASFPIALPLGTGAPSESAALFRRHDATVPRPSPWTATIAPDGTLSVRGRELSPATVTAAWFIPDEPGQIVDNAPQPLTPLEGGFTLGLRLVKPLAPGAGVHGVLAVHDRSGAGANVLLTEARAAVPSASEALSPVSQASVSQASVSEASVSPAPAFPVPVPPAPVSLGRVLAFAFLGGLILNVMPCVFPILAMKAVGFTAMPRERARGHAAAYTAGVLVTFLGVAAALLLARAAGAAAGWGFQFASPVFVAAMAWVLFAVGLNLSGVFSIGGGFAGAGEGLAARGGHWGAFFTGALAVLVATPCTAPFMGVAIAAGLAAPPVVTLLVFLIMGLGLAAPYLALAAIPASGRWLPRPGAWMEVFRQALAFPMYGASVWLLWVISQESGSTGVLAAGTGFVLVGFAAWTLGITRDTGGKGRAAGIAGAGLAMLCAGAILMGLGTMLPPETRAVETGGDSEPFTPPRLAALRAEGRPVFVNLTAAWCITCLVNERMAIGGDTVRRAFAAKQVVYLKGDWTRQDPAITAFLREQGRDGVPLYLYYAPKAAAAEILPQILTESLILSVVDPAS